MPSVDKESDTSGMEAAALDIYESCRRYTLLSLERMYALYGALQYVTRRHIDGAFVECGVWRGGSAMGAALSLLSFGDDSRHLYLYDTFEGMPPADEFDVPIHDREQSEMKGAADVGGLAVSLEDVRRNVLSTGYPEDNVRFTKGPVEETIPRVAPDKIAVLHLDTDFYSSTRHELEHLYPRIVPGGVLLLDDYGHWGGAKKAVDEYFSRHDPVLLARVDYTGRLAVKV